MDRLLCACTKKPYFEEHELEEGLPGQRCPDCHTDVLWLKDYRAWREAKHPDWEKSTPEPAVPTCPEQASKARVCPACQRLMARHRTGSEESFWLDYCVACGLVWLDDGEWEALKRDSLALHLDTLLTERWQRRVVEQRKIATREAVLRERLGGAERFGEIKRFKTWLKQQGDKKEILAYLSDPTI
jgi:Zn-finger nucleic acid-binding protein